MVQFLCAWGFSLRFLNLYQLLEFVFIFLLSNILDAGSLKHSFNQFVLQIGTAQYTCCKKETDVQC